MRLRLAKALVGVAEANALAAESIAIERGVGTQRAPLRARDRANDFSQCDNLSVSEGVFLGGGATGARRIGEEVFRPVGHWTPAVHALMRHAKAAGIDEAPGVLGVREGGSDERLEWIPGDDVGVDLGGDLQLAQVGQLVRRVHDALSSFAAPNGASWRLRQDGPAFVHGDISPWNVVWRQGRLVGLLDWDQSGPGRDLEDLAYAAWVWVPLEAPEDTPPHWKVPDVGIDAQVHRLRTLVSAYELTTAQRSVLLAEIAYVQATSVARVALGAMTGDAGMDNIWWGGRRVGVFGAAMAWLTKNWDTLHEAIRAP